MSKASSPILSTSTFPSSPRMSTSQPFSQTRPQSNYNSFNNSLTVNNNNDDPRRSEGRQPVRYPITHSQVKSQVSTISHQQNQKQLDIQSLNELEQKIVQEMLLLKEEKITLMEQHNQKTNERYKIQRQINKLKKRQSKKEQNQQTDHSSQLSNSSFYENANQKRCPNFTDQQLQTIRRIQNLQFAIKDTEEQIKQMETKKVNKSNCFGKIVSNRQNLFTFCSNKQHQNINQLRLKKQRLLKRMMHSTQKQQLKNCLLTLMQSNHQLQQTINEFYYRKEHKVQILKKRIERQQKEKQILFEDLITIKSKSKHLKIENEQLRKALTYFNYRP